MKKLFLIISAVVLSSCVVGCKSMPDPQSVETLSISIGAASGTVCKMSITNEATLATVCKVLNVVKDVIPETNSTCVATWKPIITNIVEEVRKEGKICDDEAAIIIHIGLAAAHGVDWMFKVHPDWKAYSDISAIAVKGFCKGFLFVVEKKAFCSGSEPIVIDQLAYSYFMFAYKIDD